jgi:hypothetical protein
MAWLARRAARAIAQHRGTWLACGWPDSPPWPPLRFVSCRAALAPAADLAPAGRLRGSAPTPSAASSAKLARQALSPARLVPRPCRLAPRRREIGQVHFGSAVVNLPELTTAPPTSPVRLALSLATGRSLSPAGLIGAPYSPLRQGPPLRAPVQTPEPRNSRQRLECASLLALSVSPDSPLHGASWPGALWLRALLAGAARTGLGVAQPAHHAPCPQS